MTGFKGSNMATVARNQTVISKEEVLTLGYGKAEASVEIYIDSKGLSFLSKASKIDTLIPFKAFPWIGALKFVIFKLLEIVC